MDRWFFSLLNIPKTVSCISTSFIPVILFGMLNNIYGFVIILKVNTTKKIKILQ